MSPIYQSFSRWKKETDAVMSDLYGIDTDDAGLDEEWLKSHWSSGQTSKDFVEWFGLKYDLTSKREVGIGGW
jgi:hypothetical protein